MEVTYKGIKITLTKEQEEYVNKQLLLKEEKPKKEIFKVDLYHIGGYECLRDGTRVERYDTLTEFMEEMCSFSTYRKKLNDLAACEELNEGELFEVLEGIWSDRWDDGGGSGWMEVVKNSLNDDTFVTEFRRVLKETK